MIIYDHNPIQRYRAYKILLIIIHAGWILLTSQDVSFLFLPRWDISKLQTARDGRVAGLVCEVLHVSYLDPVKCWKKMELGGWDYFWRIFLYSVPELMRDSLSCIGQSVSQSVSGAAANIFKTSFEDQWFHAVSTILGIFSIHSLEISGHRWSPTGTVFFSMSRSWLWCLWWNGSLWRRWHDPGILLGGIL